MTVIVASVPTYVDTRTLTFWDGKENALTVSTIKKFHCWTKDP